MKKPNKTVDSDIVRKFWEAHDETLFDSDVMAAVRGCSKAKQDYEAWRGTGIPYFKDGAHRRYKKKDAVKYMEGQRVETVSSAAAEATHAGDVKHAT